MKNLHILIFSILIMSFFSCKTEDKDKAKNKIQDNIKDEQITVGVFNGNGSSTVCVIETIEALKIDKGINGKEISPAEICSGDISNFDVIIFPGGSGSKELNSLGKKGKKAIHSFVKNGKGLVGICAGAYMTMSTDGYPSLKLSNMKQLDRAHYNRGRGLVEFTLTEKGTNVFPELKNKKAFLQYYDGPVMQLKDSTIKTNTEFAKFVTDITPDNYAPSGVAPGKTFIYTEDIEKGKIIAIAGHPESTPGMRWIVPRLARFVAGKELVSYDSFFVRPEINDKAILFDRPLRKREKTLFWNLLNDTASIQISALDELHSYRSRPAVRWTIGLLRDNNANVRERAAYWLKQTEYSFALPDLKSALKIEDDEAVKKQLVETINILSLK